MNIFWKTIKIFGTWTMAPQDIWLEIENVSYGGSITFKNNEKLKIKCISIIGKIYSVKTEDVQYMGGLKCNLLSIRQLCDNLWSYF